MSDQILSNNEGAVQWLESSVGDLRPKEFQSSEVSVWSTTEVGQTQRYVGSNLKSGLMSDVAAGQTGAKPGIRPRSMLMTEDCWAKSELPLKASPGRQSA